MAYDRNKGEDNLALDQIQGDVLVGLQKDYQRFIAFQIIDRVRFKQFLRNLAPIITTTQKVLEREFTIQLLKKNPNKEVFLFTGVNISFTFSGLVELGLPNLGKIKDASFRAGLPARSAAIGDPTIGPASPANWIIGKSGQNLHGLIMVTGPNGPVVNDLAASILALAGNSLNKLYNEAGLTRRHDRGHEHFGYKDGVSQPGIRGEIGGFFPKHKFLTPSLNGSDPSQASPGSALVWPGEFVFGYHGQTPSNMDAPGPVVEGGIPWMKDGTYMVFRRLKQLVPEFNRFLAELSAKLGIDEQLLGARMVGRWKSGAPLAIAPIQDNPLLAREELSLNDFKFAPDPSARRCPFAAHIRKANPRDDITFVTNNKITDGEQRSQSEADNQTHRILRRGIPFGEDVSREEQIGGITTIDRGLMFVSYQTSIENQFEFILQKWVNDPAFPPSSEGRAGHDPILGQNSGATRARKFNGAAVTYPIGSNQTIVTLPSDFVQATGGGYFFVPSTSALVDVFSV